MTRTTIRGATEADRPALRGIYRRSRTHAFPWRDPAGFSESDFDRDTEGERIWVAELEDAIAGFASLWEPEAFLHCLFVDPTLIGRGIGSALLDAALAAAIKPPTLKCNTRNVAARDFYLARGWTIAEDGEGPDGPYHLMRLGPAPD